MHPCHRADPVSHRSPPRRTRPRLPLLALCGLLAASTCGLSACGDGYGRIPLSSITPPTIRVLLGATDEAATLSIADAWEASSISGGAYSGRGSNLVGVLQAGVGGIVFRGAPTQATEIGRAHV